MRVRLIPGGQRAVLMIIKITFFHTWALNNMARVMLEFRRFDSEGNNTPLGLT